MMVFAAGRERHSAGGKYAKKGTSRKAGKMRGSCDRKREAAHAIDTGGELVSEVGKNRREVGGEYGRSRRKLSQKKKKRGR